MRSSTNAYRPRRGFETLGVLLGIGFARAELVIVVVAGDIVFRSRLEILPIHAHGREGRGKREAGHGQGAGRSHKLPTVEIHRLRGDGGGQNVVGAFNEHDVLSGRNRERHWTGVEIARCAMPSASKLVARREYGSSAFRGFSVRSLGFERCAA